MADKKRITFDEGEVFMLTVAMVDHAEAAREMALDLTASKEDHESNWEYYRQVVALKERLQKLAEVE